MLIFLFVSCGRLSFLVHFKYTLSYRTVLLLLPAGHAGIVFTQWSKNGFFSPRPRHVAPINSAPRAKYHVYRGRNVGIQPPKLSKFRILAINLLLGGQSFAQFLRNSQILYAFQGGF